MRTRATTRKVQQLEALQALQDAQSATAGVGGRLDRSSKCVVAPSATGRGTHMRWFYDRKAGPSRSNGSASVVSHPATTQSAPILNGPLRGHLDRRRLPRLKTTASGSSASAASTSSTSSSSRTAAKLRSRRRGGGQCQSYTDESEELAEFHSFESLSSVTSIGSSLGTPSAALSSSSSSSSSTPLKRAHSRAELPPPSVIDERPPWTPWGSQTTHHHQSQSQSASRTQTTVLREGTSVRIILVPDDTSEAAIAVRQREVAEAERRIFLREMDRLERQRVVAEEALREMELYQVDGLGEDGMDDCESYDDEEEEEEEERAVARMIRTKSSRKRYYSTAAVLDRRRTTLNTTPPPPSFERDGTPCSTTSWAPTEIADDICELGQDPKSYSFHHHHHHHLSNYYDEPPIDGSESPKYPKEWLAEARKPPHLRRTATEPAL